jgi:hypothetical protein
MDELFIAASKKGKKMVWFLLNIFPDYKPDYVYLVQHGYKSLIKWLIEKNKQPDSINDLFIASFNFCGMFEFMRELFPEHDFFYDIESTLEHGPAIEGID